MKNIIENEVGAILTDILDDYKKGRAVDKMDIYNQPDKTEIMDILDRLFSIVSPGFFHDIRSVHFFHALLQQKSDVHSSHHPDYEYMHHRLPPVPFLLSQS